MRPIEKLHKATANLDINLYDGKRLKVIITYESILYPPDAVQPPKAMQPPQVFTDLGLDQIVERIGRSCEEVWPFYTPVQEKATIEYRQAIMRDLEDLTIRRRFARLSQQLCALRRQLSAHGMKNLPYVRSSSLLAVADQYVSQLQEFSADFPYRNIRSKGLESFLLYLRRCLSDPQTVRMRMDAFDLEWKLQKVRYTILLNGRKIEVGKADGQESLDTLVGQLFDRFQQGSRGGGTCQAPAGESDVRNENAILELLAREYPELFEKLLGFGEKYRDFADQKLFQFGLDIQFYLSYLDNTDRMERTGGTFCYPKIIDGWDGCQAEDCFDLALAENFTVQQALPVTNEFDLHGRERLLVITGPNQGGKTTYARMLGQLFYLTSLGVRVPGSAATIRIPDRIYTHFGKTGESGADNLRSELMRLKEILDHATDRSLVLINEIFASVSHSDGLFLGEQMLKQLTGLDCMAVCVTFLEELATYGPQTVSMMSQVLPGENAERSYRLLRHAPDGQAYALSLAEKKGLTYEQIIERLTR